MGGTYYRQAAAEGGMAEPAVAGKQDKLRNGE